MLTVVDPLTFAGWDSHVQRLPCATIFHSSAWAAVLRETYGFKPSYVALSDDQQRLTGVVPLMEVNSWMTGRRGVGLPFSDECPPLCQNHADRASLVEKARALGMSRRWRYLEIRGQPDLADKEASTEFFGHHLDLREGFNALQQRFSSPTKRNIRKAQTSDTTISFDNSLESLRSFYGLLCRTRQKHGVPPQPFSFFANIHKHILAPGKGLLVMATVGERPIAGAVFLHFAGMTVYKFGASDETAQHLRPNNLVMARAIEWHATRGFAVLDFGRTSLSNQGLRMFKLGWGATETRLRYLRIVPTTGKKLSAPDEGGACSRAVFHRLPLPVSRFIGSLLYRHVA